MRRFRTDVKLENEGVWMELEHVRIKIARAGENNRAFKEHMSAEAKKLGTAIRVGMVSDEASKRILRSAYASTIIKDWETRQDDGSFKAGVEVERDGKFILVAPTVIAFEEYLKDDANSDTYRAIREFATDGGAFMEQREIEAGN